MEDQNAVIPWGLSREEFKKFVSDFTEYASREGVEVDTLSHNDVLVYYSLQSKNTSLEDLLRRYKKFVERWNTLKSLEHATT